MESKIAAQTELCLVKRVKKLKTKSRSVTLLTKFSEKCASKERCNFEQRKTGKILRSSFSKPLLLRKIFDITDDLDNNKGPE